MRTFLKTVGVIAGLAGGLLAGGLPAHAAPPNTGWNDSPDVVVSGGSDTTYLVSQRLNVLYNGDPGCVVDNAATSANKGKCNAGQTTPTNGNFDHDVFTDAQPTGSGAGINSLLSTGVAYNPSIDFARSSRGAGNAQEKQELTFWGYGRDAIAVVSFGSRTGVALSKQDLIDIYTCVKTDWSQFVDVNGAPLAAGTIIPWDMNSASGTRSTFTSYLGTSSFGTCVKKLSPANGNIAPFENDVKPLLLDDVAAGDANNYLWWISFADWQKYPFTRNGKLGSNSATTVNSNLVQIAGVDVSNSTLNSGAYPITRFIYAVTKAADADCTGADNNVATLSTVCPAAGPAVQGTTTGKGGAVRQYVEWLCRTLDNQHQVNPVTGLGYRTAIIQALNAEGFQQVAGTNRTNGYACNVQTG